jgi:hypothetical protein
MHRYACALNSAACPFCSNWVPFSWTKKTGVVSCLQTACPDTQGHLFLELPSDTESSDPSEERSSLVIGSIYTQLRQNNRSKLLCSEDAELPITKSIWKHIYTIRFTFRILVEILQDDIPAGDLGLTVLT